MLNKFGKSMSIVSIAAILGAAVAMLYPEFHLAFCTVR